MLNIDRILFTALFTAALFSFVACNDGTSTAPPSAALQGAGHTGHPPPGSDTRVDPSERAGSTVPSPPEPERVSSSQLLTPDRRDFAPVLPSDIEIGTLAVYPLAAQSEPLIRFVQETMRRLRDGEDLGELVRQDRAGVVERRVETAVEAGYRPQEYVIGVPGTDPGSDFLEVEIGVRVFRGTNSTVGAIIVGSGDQGLEIVDVHVDFEALGNAE